MGKTVERLAKERGHEIVLRSTSDAPPMPKHLEGADAAIEFTEPGSAVKNILTCFNAGVPVVTGTTGWYNRLDEVKSACHKESGSLLFASNFSIGVNVFNLMVKHASELMRKVEGYKPSLFEAHHTGKKDAPSGTALTLSDLVLDAYDHLDGWSDRKEDTSKLLIESLREGDIKGLHEVRFTSSIDEITLKHEAFNRDGFALGAVKAAEWLNGRTGTYTMRDLLKNVLE